MFIRVLLTGEYDLGLEREICKMNHHILNIHCHFRCIQSLVRARDSVSQAGDVSEQQRIITTDQLWLCTLDSVHVCTPSSSLYTRGISISCARRAYGKYTLHKPEYHFFSPQLQPTFLQNSVRGLNTNVLTHIRGICLCTFSLLHSHGSGK